MIKLRLMLMAFLLLSVQALLAQSKTVTGKVTDSKDGSPIPGVSVVLKGSNTGTTTGPDGAFQIEVPANSVALIFSSLGYGTKEIEIKGTTIDVGLDAGESRNLDEVVVVGFGTKIKKILLVQSPKLAQRN